MGKKFIKMGFMEIGVSGVTEIRGALPPCCDQDGRQVEGRWQMVSPPGSSCSLIAVRIAKSIFVAVRSIIR